MYPPTKPIFNIKLKQNTHTEPHAKPVIMTTVRKNKDYLHKTNWHLKIKHTYFQTEGFLKQIKHL